MTDAVSPSSLGVAIVMSLGLAFDLVGCLGLVRLPDLYNRLQAATKCVTLGTFLLLLGVLIQFGFNSMGIKALLCMWFVAMTSPTAAHAIARAAHRAGFPLWERSVMDRYAEDREGQVQAGGDPGAGQPTKPEEVRP